MAENHTLEELTGTIVEQQSPLTLAELCSVCKVDAQWICELVDEGILEPEAADMAQWTFAGTTLRRVRMAQRLQRDLGINTSGIALALELLDEIQVLRMRFGLEERG